MVIIITHPPHGKDHACGKNIESQLIVGFFDLQTFRFIFIKKQIMEISFFKGKPLEKLLDVISNAIGRVYNPIAIRNEADAEAYKIQVIENAKSKALMESRLTEVKTFEKIQERITYKELKRQKNIDAVVNVAVEQLKLDFEVSSVSVNQDWSSRFFNIVEDVSEDIMQNLWGKILSGEVKQPGSFSLRTLELLKNLTKSEAELFLKIAQYAIVARNDFAFILDVGSAANREGIYKLTYMEEILLEELGLLNPTVIDFVVEVGNYRTEFFYHSKILSVVRENANLELKIPIVRFTTIGSELINLINQNYNDEYVKYFADIVKRAKGVKLTKREKNH